MPSISLESLSLLSQIGLGVQLVGTWLLAAVLLTLGRASGRPAWFRDWARAFVMMGIALTALAVRYAVADPPDPAGGSSLLRGLVRLGYGVYLEGKLFFAALLLFGTLRFARGEDAPRWRAPAALALFVYGALVAILKFRVESLLVLQAPILIASCASSAWLLLRIEPARRNTGSRLAGITLLAHAVLWLGYLWYFSGHLGWVEPGEQRLRDLFLASNSYVDLLLEVLLAAGLTVLLLQEVHRQAMQAQAEREQLEERMSSSQKLRAVGGFVSGIAHELNNPLTAILGFAQELEREERHPRRSRSLAVVREQAERCRGILRRLSAFAIDREPLRASLDARQLVQRVARGFEPQLSEKEVRLLLDLPEGLPRIEAEAVGLEQVLANLLANALQASPPGGKIVLSARVRDASGESSLELCVEDEGPGFAPEVLRRAFEPFFTTKAEGQGSGLGLAVVHGIVEAHGGSAEASNRPPPHQGARLLVRLPLHAGTRDPGPATPPPQLPSPKGLRVLVVDDEPFVREVLRVHLEGRGWNVVEVDRGEGALSLLLDPREDFDAVLCDLRMPGVSGSALQERLAEDAPHLLPRLLFVTGDPHSPEARELTARSQVELVSKPFDLAALTARLERAARRARSVGAV